MREDLLGYLLDALEPDEMQRVERALRDDPLLRDQLRQIQRMLQPLEEHRDEQEFEPPPGLVSRTMALIDAADSGVVPPRVGSAAMCTATDRPASPASVSEWGWWDSLVSGLAAAALIGIVLPAILRGRFEARKMVCQDHLRQLGQGLTAFALADPRQQLPQLTTEGPEAFAGVYAVRLGDAGLIDQPRTRWCPSTDRPQTPAALPPTLEQLHAAALDRLAMMQRTAGGSYAYSLGVMDGTRYRSPRYQGRATFAVLGDAPALLAGSDRPQVPHGQQGVNLLYEDGHVAFVRYDALRSAPDPPFVNHFGAVEAGVNADDATLAPSWRPPFTRAR